MFALRVHFLLWGSFATVNGVSVTGDYRRTGSPRLVLEFANGEITIWSAGVDVDPPTPGCNDMKSRHSHVGLVLLFLFVGFFVFVKILVVVVFVSECGRVLRFLALWNNPDIIVRAI
jgi:hypothetical protein